MTIDGNILDDFESVLDMKVDSSRPGSSKTVGTVSRIDKDGSVWVRLAGASTDTPCRTVTAASKPGDTVEVEVGGGSARITGNVTSPSTDDKTAETALSNAKTALGDAATAYEAASAAEISAVSAIQSAETAYGAAQDAIRDAAAAQSSADDAATAASDAQTSAGTAASAAAQASADAATANENALQAIDSAYTAGVAASIAQAAAEAVDGRVDEMENWFYHDTLGAHVLGNSDGYRTDIVSTGMNVVDTSDMRPVAVFGASGAQVGKENGMHLYMTQSELAFVDERGDRVAYIAVDSASNESLFYMTRAMIVSDLRFGDDGDWQFQARSNRNLALKWTGGSV